MSRHYDVDAHGGFIEDSVEIRGSRCDVEITAYGVTGMFRKFAGIVEPDDRDDRVAAEPAVTRLASLA